MKPYVVIILPGAVIVIACLLAPGRRLRDWLMIVGSTMATFGIWGINFIANPDPSAGLAICCGSMGCGSLLFAMGFLTDQLIIRRQRINEEQITGADSCRRTLAEGKNRSPAQTHSDRNWLEEELTDTDSSRITLAGREGPEQ